MAAGNDVIMLGTSKGWVTRYDFGVGDSIGMILHLITFMRSNLITFLFSQSRKCFPRSFMFLSPNIILPEGECWLVGWTWRKSCKLNEFLLSYSFS